MFTHTYMYYDIYIYIYVHMHIVIHIYIYTYIEREGGEIILGGALASCEVAAVVLGASLAAAFTPCVIIRSYNFDIIVVIML